MFHCTPGRGEYIIEFGTCYNPGKVLTFSRELIMDCVGYPYVSSPTATEGQSF